MQGTANVSSDESTSVSTYGREGVVWLIVTHILVGTIAAFAARDSGRGPASPQFMFGPIVFSQCSLLGIWCALGTAALGRRLLGAIGGVTFLYLLVGFGVGDASIETFLIISMVTAFVTAVLLVVRLFRIVIHHDSSPFASSGSFQFSIRHLLILTFVIACLVTLVKSSQSTLPPPSVLLAMALYAFTFSLIGIVPVGLVLATKRPVRNGLAFVPVATCSAFCLGLMANSYAAVAAATATGAESLSMVISLFVLRSCGYRLARCRRQV